MESQNRLRFQSRLYGTNVKVEDLAPSGQIFRKDEDVWTFGSGGVGVWYGQVNRITVRFIISVNKSINLLSLTAYAAIKAKSFSNGCAPRRELAMASGYRGVFLIGNKAANRTTDVQVVDAGGNTIPLPFSAEILGLEEVEPNYKTLPWQEDVEAKQA